MTGGGLGSVTLKLHWDKLRCTNFAHKLLLPSYWNCCHLYDTAKVSKRTVARAHAHAHTNRRVPAVLCFQVYSSHVHSALNSVSVYVQLQALICGVSAYQNDAVALRGACGLSSALGLEFFAKYTTNGEQLRNRIDIHPCVYNR